MMERTSISFFFLCGKGSNPCAARAILRHCRRDTFPLFFNRLDGDVAEGSLLPAFCCHSDGRASFLQGLYAGLCPVCLTLDDLNNTVWDAAPCHICVCGSRVQSGLKLGGSILL